MRGRNPSHYYNYNQIVNYKTEKYEEEFIHDDTHNDCVIFLWSG